MEPSGFSGGGSGSSCTGDGCASAYVVFGIVLGSIYGIPILLGLAFLGVSYCINYKKGRPFKTNVAFIKNDTTDSVVFIKNHTTESCNQEKSDTSMFKSGYWKSQYFQYGKWHGPCRFSLTFDTNSMTVKGTGSDDIGKFTINGIYSLETNRLGLSKKYQLGTGNKTENLGHTVTIQLTWNKVYKQFEGNWYVRTNKYHGNDKFQLKFDGHHLSTVYGKV